MISFGRGRYVHVSGSTHKPDGMRDVSTQSVHDQLVRRFLTKIDSHREEITRLESRFMEDAEVVIVSYGASARPSLGAVLEARRRGLKVGYLRLITIWPFPRREISALNQRIDRIFVPEMNLGQLSREIERFVSCPVESISKIGGVSLMIKEILEPVLKHFKQDGP